MRNQRKAYVFVAIAAVVVVSLFGAALLIGKLEDQPAVTKTVNAGSSATAAVIYATSFPDLMGVAQPLGQWSRKLLIVNFWATWCAPCIEEIPMLVRMQEKHGAAGLQIVGIAADSLANSSNLAKKLAINYPVLPDESRAIEFSKRVGNQFGLLPFSIILSPAGDIVTTKLGVMTEEEITNLVEKYPQKS